MKPKDDKTSGAVLRSRQSKSPDVPNKRISTVRKKASKNVSAEAIQPTEEPAKQTKSSTTAESDDKKTPPVIVASKDTQSMKKKTKRKRPSKGGTTEENAPTAEEKLPTVEDPKLADASGHLTKQHPKESILSTGSVGKLSTLKKKTRRRSSECQTQSHTKTLDSPSQTNTPQSGEHKRKRFTASIKKVFRKKSSVGTTEEQVTEEKLPTVETQPNEKTTETKNTDKKKELMSEKIKKKRTTSTERKRAEHSDVKKVRKTESAPVVPPVPDETAQTVFELIRSPMMPLKETATATPRKKRSKDSKNLSGEKFTSEETTTEDKTKTKDETSEDHVPGAAKHGDKAKDKKIESKEKVEDLPKKIGAEPLTLKEVINIDPSEKVSAEPVKTKIQEHVEPAKTNTYEPADTDNAKTHKNDEGKISMYAAKSLT